MLNSINLVTEHSLLSMEVFACFILSILILAFALLIHVSLPRPTSQDLVRLSQSERQIGEEEAARRKESDAQCLKYYQYAPKTQEGAERLKKD